MTVIRLCSTRTSSPGKKYLTASDHPTFALVNPSFGKTGKGMPGCHPFLGTACLMQLLVLYDGDASFEELLNKKFNTTFTLDGIRRDCGFSSSSRIYCLVMFAVKLSTPRPMECKLRLGWGTGHIPVVTTSIEHAFKLAKRTRQEDPAPAVPENIGFNSEDMNSETKGGGMHASHVAQPPTKSAKCSDGSSGTEIHDHDSQTLGFKFDLELAHFQCV